ncbi:MAG: alpha/beta hydrolase [Spirochaetes bacterium]|nr:alpha/beta hydrolase [Spirochaetota bacterium]
MKQSPCTRILCVILLVLPSHLGSVETLPEGMSTVHLPDGDDGQQREEIPVDVFIPPKGMKTSGDMLVLPGWRFSRDRWYRETDLLSRAGRMGIRAVFQEMAVTCYESRYFPETRMKWARTPGGEWIRTVLIPVMRSRYGIFERGNRNYLLGLSTGARGVLLVALQNPGIFSACAALSGDCDQSIMPGDRLTAAIYGSFHTHRRRWAEIDNPLAAVKRGEWTAPLYIGHGRRDAVSPFSQSELLYRTLSARGGGIPIVFSDPAWAGHDFRYWKSELPAIMRFFEDNGGAR